MQEKKRTISQNASLHKYLTMVCEDLNEAGYTVTKVLKHDAEIPWTPTLAKELLFRPIMKALYNKQSTKELTTKELTQAVEVLSHHLAEKIGISTDFPSMESLLTEGVK